MWSNAIHETIRGGGPKFFSLIYKCLFCSPTLSTMTLYVQMTKKKKCSSKHFSGTEDFLVKTNKKSKKTKRKGKKNWLKKLTKKDKVKKHNQTVRLRLTVCLNKQF